MKHLTSIHDAHSAVMPQAVISALSIDPDGIYVDSTYGRGGHSSGILARLSTSGKLYAFDCDAAAIEVARRTHRDDLRFEAVHAQFSTIGNALRSRQPDIRLAGVVADLGVSSPQLDQEERGFSFYRDGPLDMRMNQSGNSLSAAEWLNSVSEKHLSNALSALGGERYARRIARTIVERRAESPLTSTRELAELVSECVPTRETDKHPATRTFLAIRMHINRELEELSDFLPQCVDLLKRGGRLVVITFHSIEDRLVKRFMREASVGAPGPQQIPFRASDFRPTLKVIGRPQRPDALEVDRNRRARSAVMRVAERIGDTDA